MQTDQIKWKALAFWSRHGRDSLDFSLEQSGSLLLEHFSFGHPVYLLSDKGENSSHENGAFIYPFCFISYHNYVCSYSAKCSDTNTTDLLSSIEKFKLNYILWEAISANSHAGLIIDMVAINMAVKTPIFCLLVITLS